MFFKIFIYLFIYYVYNILPVYMPAGQKRAPDPITDGCELPCGCWELNPGPLEEQAMLLTSEPSLQPSNYVLIDFFASLYVICCYSCFAAQHLNIFDCLMILKIVVIIIANI